MIEVPLLLEPEAGAEAETCVLLGAETHNADCAKQPYLILIIVFSTVKSDKQPCLHPNSYSNFESSSESRAARSSHSLYWCFSKL
jgi:hypothetical protein